MAADIIDRLVGITPGSELDLIRRNRDQARSNAQLSFETLFQPADASQMSLAERLAVASFVAGLHHDAELSAFYADMLEQDADGELADAVAAEADLGRTRGPYGDFPAGPLTAENKPGPHYFVSPQNAEALGQRLTAAFQHVHMLVFHPRDASTGALQQLADAGWSTTGIVTLSQLVAFLCFQIRVVVGLRKLKALHARQADGAHHG